MFDLAVLDSFEKSIETRPRFRLTFCAEKRNGSFFAKCTSFAEDGDPVVRFDIGSRAGRPSDLFLIFLLLQVKRLVNDALKNAPHTLFVERSAVIAGEP